MFGTGDPFSLIIVLVALGIAPFLAVLVTSFTKLVVVMSLIRNALGVQNVPPNFVLNGLAMILSLYIMFPAFSDSFDVLSEVNWKDMEFDQQKEVLFQAVEPFREFLLRNSDRQERRFFLETAAQIWPPDKVEGLSDDHLIVLIPAFTLGELTEAFQIGFLLYLPFIAIDLIISNILLAMGMMMVSPMTISLPFKLLLFVLVDGWSRLIQGLILTYT